MNKLSSFKGMLLASPILFTTAFANEQPVAEDLVGKYYGGLHLLHIETDNDRVPVLDPLLTNDPYATADDGSGFGAELGYRLSESTEFRLSYSQINLTKTHSFFDKPYVAVMDGLYFPTQQNFYVLGGLGYLDVGEEKLSLEAGAGYRHYLSEGSAIYLEGKRHYQFSGDYQDTSAHLGFIIFFGGESNSSPARKQRKSEAKGISAASATNAKAMRVANDSDNDGILDQHDKCDNTPIVDKVNEEGCTVFSEETESMQLLVNFDHNKSVVKNKYIPVIKNMANFLTAYPEVSLIIEGHTSKVGTEAYNQKISQQRANAIVQVLINQFNIDSSRLSAIGYGEERLLDSGNDNAAHAKNRRIEAKVSITKKVAVSR